MLLCVFKKDIPFLRCKKKKLSKVDGNIQWEKKNVNVSDGGFFVNKPDT